MFGLSGIKNLNYYFKIKRNKQFEDLNIITAENKKTKIEFCPIISGLNFLDQVRSLERLSEIKFENIAYPLLFLPFVSRASEVIGKRIHLKLDNFEFLMNFNHSIFSNFSKNQTIELSENICLKILDNQDSFDENEWNELYKLSENTFV